MIKKIINNSTWMATYVINANKFKIKIRILQQNISNATISLPTDGRDMSSIFASRMRWNVIIIEVDKYKYIKTVSIL